MTQNVKFEVLILMPCHAVLQKFSNAFEECAAYIFRAVDGGSMSF
jgi:hypothetical protein